jgi:ribonuclease HI
MQKITIFTDGAAKGNPGPGGYGAVLSVGDKVLEIGERKERTTNNEMELKAVVEALKQVPKKVVSVEIYTDSKYVVEGATAWTFGWSKNGWKTKNGNDVLHKALWQELVDLLQRIDVTWYKVPGHVGIIGNERADTIASNFGDDKLVRLYKGSKSDYEFNLDDVTYDEEKASQRSEARKRQAQKAYSYVSLVNGEVVIHNTWTECEARVKGQKARFKKALSAEEEKEIIADFKKGV